MLHTCPALTPDRPEERQVDIVTEHWYITPFKDGRVYVNPFKDCTTAEKLFHIIDLILKGRLDPYMFTKLPYVVGSEKLPEGTLEEGNVHPDAMVFDAIQEKGKQLIYKDARSCYVHLRKLNPKLVPLPARKLDITEGLQEIQDYCVNVARGEEKNKQTNGKAVETSWWLVLYEKTIKAIFSAILEFFQKS